jgi:hypothetical protein
MCRPCGEATKSVTVSLPPTSASTVAEDLRQQRFVRDLQTAKAKYAEALKTIESQQQALEVLGVMKEHTEAVSIVPHFGGGTSEATPVVVASDWHVEQSVTFGETNGLNEFNLDVAHARMERFFNASLRLIKLLNQDVHIHTVVVGLLGDFITGQIHGAANAEKNLLPPTQAIVFAQNHLIGGIQFWLNNSDYDFLIVCKIGNHSRTTEKSRIGSENGHSYEYLMYLWLQAEFKNEPRVKFLIEDSFNSYVPIYGETFRFNHGHTIRFQGGVGGLFIPAYKKINKWDQARPATRTIIGHHHQMLDGGNFHCNGSLIGFDGRTAGEGYSFERPAQTLLLVDKKRGQTCKWPILLEK